MKVIYAILTAVGWLWLVVVMVWLWIRSRREERAGADEAQATSQDAVAGRTE